MIFIDTREQANTHILKEFERRGLERGIDFSDTVLSYGDYYSTESGITVERKKNLSEFANNCGKGHAQFKAELEKLKAVGGKMYILIEQEILYDDLSRWVNPRGKQKLRTLKDGSVKIITPMAGAQMRVICDRWLEQYNIEFVFCAKNRAGSLILEILQEWTF